MRRFCVLAAAVLGSGAFAMPAAAQDETDEFVVTGVSITRNSSATVDAIEAEDLSPPRSPASSLMVRRRADYAVQAVEITGDTVDDAMNRQEVLAMARKAIELADRGGVELATGGALLQPLTLANYMDLNLQSVSYPSPGRKVTFLVKVSLAAVSDVKNVFDRIESYIASVPAVGRAQMRATDDLALSVVEPEQYRGAIIERIAAGTAASLTPFGTGYAVNVTGLEWPVQWAWAGRTDVNLYLPIMVTVVPRP